METDQKKPRLVGRLYFRFIAGTSLEKQGWTADSMADFLEEIGMIETLECEPTNSSYKSGSRHALERPVLQRHYVEKTQIPPKAVVINLALASRARNIREKE